MSLLVVAVLVRCKWSIDLGVAYLPVLCAPGPRRMILVTGLGGITPTHQTHVRFFYFFMGESEGKGDGEIRSQIDDVTWHSFGERLMWPWFFSLSLPPPEKKEKDIWLFFEGDEWGWLPAEKVCLGLECEGILPVLLEWAIYLASTEHQKLLASDS